MAQGDRFARAQFYLERGRAEAARLGVPCRWSRVVVPGVAHEGMRMSAFAGDYWFGGKSELRPERNGEMTQMAERAVTDRAPAAMIAGAIPLIDVSGHLAGDSEAGRKAAAQLRWAFENIGFYYLSGHGVAQSLIDRTYEAAARFHAQPMSKKLTLKVNEHNIGYLPISDAASPQAAAQGRKPSQNEAYFLRRERAPDDPAVIANKRFHGLNQWPADLPGFREQTLEYMHTLEALCRRLVRLYALALDLPADFFDRCFAEPHMILRMSRYPVIDREDETVANSVPHTDSGFMTLLPPNRVPGLSICCQTDAGSKRPVLTAPMSSTAATFCTAGPTSGSCRRRIACATSRARCAMRSHSSVTPITTR